MSFNLNGIRAAHRKGFLDFLEKTQPDVICLQEIKAHEDDIPALLDGYHACWFPAERKGYSGVGILSKIIPDRTLKGIGINRYDKEGRVLRADFGSLSVLCVYVPSGSSTEERQGFKMQFLKAFYKHVKTLLEQPRRLIICGDINIAHKKIDLTNWQQNQGSSGFLPEERRWLDRFLKLGLVDSYRQHIGPATASYSWWSLRTAARARNVGWRLDYQFVTPDLAKTIRHGDIPSEPIMSDHAPVIVDYQL